MNSTITSRQRMLMAMRNEVPDRVPVCPDISNMIPANLTGKPYWNIYLYDSPSLGEAYLEAIQRLGMDGWYLYGHVLGGNKDFPLDSEDTTGLVYNTFFVPKDLVSRQVKQLSDDEVQEQLWVKTPFGKLESTTSVFRSAPPWDVSNFVKDIPKDWPRLRWLMGETWHWDDQCYDQEKVGELAVYGLQVHTFVDFWDGVRDGQSDKMIYDFYDHPDLMAEIFDFYQAFTLTRVEGLIRAGVDEILVQGSNSSMSLINPEIYRKFVLPLNIEITKLARELGCVSHLHTCGCSRLVVEMNMEKANFNIIEPLEKPPSGDVDIADVKSRYGNRVALKGNLLTSGKLLHGTPGDVELEVIETLRAGGQGGGFILSSGDQVGGNTPLENLQAMVDTGKKYGRYDAEGNLPDLPDWSGVLV
ncbi:uroporphyrinogen decarboxylase family protein [bacterium]|nr:uroporphyrinogen decarboxylase family protein [bacterium]